MPRYRAGVVGCGGIGRSHASGYEEHEDVELVAAADIDPDAVDTFEDRFEEVPTYDDHDSMLREEDIDLYSVCTSHRSHASLTVDGIESGVRGVVCEKPMATSLGEAIEMAEAAERNDTRLTVGHQRRYWPVNERARELIEETAIGPVRAVEMRTTGGLLNIGTHFIDQLLFILGDPGWEWVAGHVERTTDRYERGLEAEDSCIARICLDTGTRFTIESDTASPLPMECDVLITGRDGTMQLSFARGRRAAEDDSQLHVLTSDGTSEYIPSRPRRARLRFVDELIEWIEGNRDDHRCSAEHSMSTVELMMGLYESVRTQETVTSPLSTRANPLLEMIESGKLSPKHPGPYDIRHQYTSVRRE